MERTVKTGATRGAEKARILAEIEGYKREIDAALVSIQATRKEYLRDREETERNIAHLQQLLGVN